MRGGRWLVDLGGAALLVGLFVVLVAHHQEQLAVHSVDDCWFTSSCGTEPGVVVARRLATVGWTFVGASFVLGALGAKASPAPLPSRSPRVRTALVGLGLVVAGSGVRFATLRGFVPPPSFGCQDRGTCAADPPWTTGAVAYDVALLLPVLGCGCLAVALLLQLRRR